jgi:hypothetical protein
MSQTRKKVEVKEVIKPEPKKRVEPRKETNIVIPTIPVDNIPPPLIIIDSQKIKSKTKPDRYVRYGPEDFKENHKLINDKKSSGEISLAYYAVDNEIGYHYYIINK